MCTVRPGVRMRVSGASGIAGVLFAAASVLRVLPHTSLPNVRANGCVCCSCARVCACGCATLVDAMEAAGGGLQAERAGTATGAISNTDQTCKCAGLQLCSRRRQTQPHHTTHTTPTHHTALDQRCLFITAPQPPGHPAHTHACAAAHHAHTPRARPAAVGPAYGGCACCPRPPRLAKRPALSPDCHMFLRLRQQCAHCFAAHAGFRKGQGGRRGGRGATMRHAHGCMCTTHARAHAGAGPGRNGRSPFTKFWPSAPRHVDRALTRYNTMHTTQAAPHISSTRPCCCPPV